MAYSHVSHKFRIDQVVEERIKSASYGVTIGGRTKFYGTSRKPIEETDGRLEPDDGSIEMSRKAYQDLIRRFGVAGILDKVFVLIIERVNADGTDYWKTTLRKCRFKDPKDSTDDGGDTTMVTLAFSFLDLDENGNQLIKAA